MKKILIGAVLAVASWHAAASPNVGVSVSVDQPGIYGRVDIGNVPQPPVVVYEQPVIIHQPAVRVERRPIYLRVPPGHAKNWGRHCGRYDACGQPVYFVREEWYQEHYVRRPGRGHGHHDRHEKHEKHDKHQKHGKHDRDDRGHHGGGHRH